MGESVLPQKSRVETLSASKILVLKGFSPQDFGVGKCYPCWQGCQLVPLRLRLTEARADSGPPGQDGVSLTSSGTEQTDL